MSEQDTLHYEDDFALWVEAQVKLLRDRDFERLDVINIMDELDGLAGNLCRELENRMVILLQHLLNCRTLPAQIDRSWPAVIRRERREMAMLLEQSPSLRLTLPEVVAYAYPHAVIEAADDTGFVSDRFPAECPWTVEEILGEA